MNTQLELWGGPECTVNRAGETYFDQLERTGHAHRLADLDLFADLGVRALRYPVLWERTAPNGIENADWTWPDERPHRLRELGIAPIAGLTHHGSGRARRVCWTRSSPESWPNTRAPSPAATLGCPATRPSTSR